MTTTNDPLLSALTTLTTGALFFAMRSCEYSTTNKTDGIRKTKIITVENVRFYKSLGDGTADEIPQTSQLCLLQRADCVSITFVSQKNGEKMATITQHRSDNTPLCPVLCWASTVHRVLSYKGTTPQSTVNTFLQTGKTPKLVRISAAQIRAYIRETVRRMGPKRLGVNPNQVGTHSVRSSCAMLLYLAQVRTSTIMLLGRWKSDAFLLYLRRQVKEFTAGVSDIMTSQPEMFFNIPAHSSNVDNRHTSEPEDPMVPSRDSIASTSRINGPTRASPQRTPARTTALRLWG